MGTSFEQGIARHNSIHSNITPSNESSLAFWNEEERKDCSRTGREYTSKTAIAKIAVRRWYYMGSDGKANTNYNLQATGTPRPCASILDYRVSGQGPSLGE